MPRPTIALVALLLPAALAGQAPISAGARPSAALAYENFADHFGNFLVSAFDSIPAIRYDYRPTPVQQSVGYIAQHLERANYDLCARFGNMKHAWTARDSLPDTIKARWPKDTLVARLRTSLRFCDSALARVDSLDFLAASYLLAFETDLAEHYSQISSYMRLLGMVPPSALSAPPRTSIVLPASALAAYVGLYQIAPGLQLDVKARDGSLIVSSSVGSTRSFLPESNSTFFTKRVDAQITFVRDASGAVAGLILTQDGRERRATRIR